MPISVTEPLLPQTTWATLGPATITFLRLFWQASWASPASCNGWSLDDRNPALIDQMLPFFDWFYHHYFRVKTEGWEQIPAQGRLLLVGSHNGGLAAPDAVMMTYDWIRRFGSDRPAYALMDPQMWRVFPGVARMATWAGCIRAESHLAVQALRREAAVLIYPGGVRDVFRPHSLRNQVCFFGEKGFIKLALLESAPIVPLISHGAHDTLWVLADFHAQVVALHQRGWPWPLGFDPGTFPLYLGLPWGLALGPLPNIPLPVPLHTRVCAPITFSRYGPAAAHDAAYVNECYERVHGIMQQELDHLFALYE
ncbi:MAG TPA: 1-acyl-sn-glycerol-3-phosphate acyltransferase [Leptolyngbyaceae cyanobacterium M65_K2018_010]|nr:1-acyl-sn-glycerol-3-phosphate acyltransferase [Leptolyngbyaceae cyanobacterium M65_K2018_010]